MRFRIKEPLGATMKNIVIFSDGTGQAGGVRPDQRLSNIYKLYRASRVDPSNAIDPAKQVAFYDAGLGTDEDASGGLSVWRFLQKLLGSATGRGISRNVADCYEFILNHYEPGDKIWLFGFSRGAYTVRCVANVLSLCGVATTESDKLPLSRFCRSTRQIAEEAVREVYEHGAGHPLAAFETERDEKARRFRVKYGSDDGDLPNAAPYFIGVFDTVAALGAKGIRRLGIVILLALIAALPLAAVAGVIAALSTAGFWAGFAGLAIATTLITILNLRRRATRTIEDFPQAGERRSHQISWRADNYDRSLSGRVMYARHAISIDEARADFPRVKWGREDIIRKKVEGDVEPLIQLWFAGNHSDIGGSYPETESRLSDIALNWMIEETQSVPVKLELERSNLHLYPSADGMQHCEIEAFRDRWLAWVPEWAPAWLKQGWKEAPRRGSIGAPKHTSVAERFKLTNVRKCGRANAYRPPALSEDAEFGSLYCLPDPTTTERLLL